MTHRQELEQRVDVLPCDREAWIAYEDWDGAFADRVRSGSEDNTHGLQLFARHRQAFALSERNAERAIVTGEAIRLVTIWDDGESEPHEAETCGIFLTPAAVRSYVENRFDCGAPYRAEVFGAPEDLKWRLLDRQGNDTDLVLCVWREPFFATAIRSNQDAE